MIVPRPKIVATPFVLTEITFDETGGHHDCFVLAEISDVDVKQLFIEVETFCKQDLGTRQNFFRVEDSFLLFEGRILACMREITYGFSNQLE